MIHYLKNLFKRRKPTPPQVTEQRGEQALDSRDLNEQFLANASLGVRFICDPRLAQKLALATTITDGVASIPRWRISISGLGDKWTLNTTTEDGHEIQIVSSNLPQLLIHFSAQYGTQKLNAMIEAHTKDRA